MHIRNVTTKSIDECNAITNLSFAELGNKCQRNRPFQQAQGTVLFGAAKLRGSSKNSNHINESDLAIGCSNTARNQE